MQSLDIKQLTSSHYMSLYACALVAEAGYEKGVGPSQPADSQEVTSGPVRHALTGITIADALGTTYGLRECFLAFL